MKEAKLKTYITQFKELKMKEDENIISFFLRVDDNVNTIRGLVKRLKKLLWCQIYSDHSRYTLIIRS